MTCAAALHSGPIVASPALGIFLNARGNRKSASDGSGALSATTAMTYTVFGDLETIDGSLPARPIRPSCAMTMRGGWSARTIPTPTARGRSRCARCASRGVADGAVTRQELGTVTGLANADWAAFSPAQAVDIGYDSNARNYGELR